MRVMNKQDAISGKEGMIYITIDGKVYEYAEVIKFEAKITYKKSAVKSVGRGMEGSKIVGANGTGNMTVHYHRPENRAMALAYVKSGKTPVMDATVINDDPTSSAGKQTTLIKNLVPDEALIAKLDADEEDTLKEEIPFTFDDFDYLDQFRPVQ